MSLYIKSANGHNYSSYSVFWFVQLTLQLQQPQCFFFFFFFFLLNIYMSYHIYCYIETTTFSMYKKRECAQLQQLQCFLVYSIGTIATVLKKKNIYMTWNIYYYIDITNFTIFSQLLRYQFLTNRKKKKYIYIYI